MWKLIIALLTAIGLGYLSQIDLRLLDGTVSNPSASSVRDFYNMFGGVLMNDLYHHTFENKAMEVMIEQCGFADGETILEIGPGSGFLAEKVLAHLPNPSSTLYYGIEISSTMHEKSSQRLAQHIAAGTVQLHVVEDSLAAAASISFPVDKIVLTYVMDLMPEDVLHEFVAIFRSKLRSSSSKVCVVNLTYGIDPLSRIVTNLWQLAYKYLGGERVGGCRPLVIGEFFSPSAGFRVEQLQQTVSAGLPSEIAVIRKID